MAKYECPPPKKRWSMPQSSLPRPNMSAPPNKKDGQCHKHSLPRPSKRVHPPPPQKKVSILWKFLTNATYECTPSPHCHLCPVSKSPTTSHYIFHLENSTLINQVRAWKYQYFMPKRAHLKGLCMTLASFSFYASKWARSIVTPHKCCF